MAKSKHRVSLKSILNDMEKGNMELKNWWLKDRISNMKFTSYPPNVYSNIQKDAFNSLREICLDKLLSLHSNKHEGKYRTQKVIGIQDMRTYHIPGISQLFDNLTILPYSLPLCSIKGKFARPAPMTPRHGFVESRVVQSWVDLLNLYRETLEADPDGELIIMDQFTGDFSAVATNAGISWGIGNDGATTGAAGTVTIPSAVGVELWNRTIFASRDFRDFGVTECVYLEIVQNVEDKNSINSKEELYLVQRRNGPEVPTTVDYIPQDMKIKTILDPKDYKENLLKWEMVIKEHKGKPGIVVSHKGGTLSSHFAVHAIENNIPVVCSKNVYVGKTLEKVGDDIPKLSDTDLKALSRSVLKWLNKKYISAENKNECRNILYTAIGSVHSMSRWDNSPMLMQFRAIAIASLIRFLNAAVAGELRHWDRHGPGRDGDEDEDGDEEESYSGGKTMRTTLKCAKYLRTDRGRTRIWKPYLDPLALSTRLKTLNNIYLDFGEEGWNSSYGGNCWQDVTLALINLVKATMLFVRKPIQANWTEVMLTLNTALHTAHNNGLAVTKWCNNDHVSTIAAVPTFGFTNTFAARTALGMQMYSKKINGEHHVEMVNADTRRAA
jgi:hypothetical protein